jgi:hypothetical protein
MEEEKREKCPKCGVELEIGTRHSYGKHGEGYCTTYLECPKRHYSRDICCEYA